MAIEVVCGYISDNSATGSAIFDGRHCFVCKQWDGNNVVAIDGSFYTIVVKVPSTIDRFLVVNAEWFISETTGELIEMSV